MCFLQAKQGEAKKTQVLKVVLVGREREKIRYRYGIIYIDWMKTRVRDNGSVKRLYVTKRKVHFLVVSVHVCESHTYYKRVNLALICEIEPLKIL